VAEALGARVIKQPNGGICAARNTGILAATQPWIALLDHDDTWLPEKLERQWAVVQQFPEAVMVATDCVVVSRTGEVLDASMADRPAIGYEQLPVAVRDGDTRLHRTAFDDLALTGWFLLPSAVVMQRDALIQAGMFDVRTRRWEDTSCFLRILKYGALAFVKAPLARWVMHESNGHKDQLAMMLGFLELYAIMQAEPERFPASYIERMRRQRPAILRDLARIAIDVPQAGSPARLAASSFAQAPSVRSLTLMVAGLLPRRLARKLVGLNRHTIA